MPASTRRLACLLAVVAMATALAACGDSPASPTSPTSPASTPAPSASFSASATPSDTAPSLTPVPGGTGPSPEASEAAGTTTETEWGTILDEVPADFPVYPGAEPADPVDGPASGAWTVSSDAATVAGWYENELAAEGYSTNDRSGPLEDGSYVVDTRSDLPECRIQTRVRPQGDATRITVLFGAGCVGLGG